MVHIMASVWHPYNTMHMLCALGQHLLCTWAVVAARAVNGENGGLIGIDREHTAH